MATEQASYGTGQPMNITPRGVSLTRSVNASLSSSTEITLNTRTTFIRLYAIAQDVYLRWGIENCNASTFDEVVPVGQVLDLSVPAGYTAFNAIERVSGATLIVVEK
jgi:hypothetical protein